MFSDATRTSCLAAAAAGCLWQAAAWTRNQLLVSRHCSAAEHTGEDLDDYTAEINDELLGTPTLDLATHPATGQRQVKNPVATSTDSRPVTRAPARPASRPSGESPSEQLAAIWSDRDTQAAQALASQPDRRLPGHILSAFLTSRTDIVAAGVHARIALDTPVSVWEEPALRDLTDQLTYTRQLDDLGITVTLPAGSASLAAIASHAHETSSDWDQAAAVLAQVDAAHPAMALLAARAALHLGDHARTIELAQAHARGIIRTAFDTLRDQAQHEQASQAPGPGDGDQTGEYDRPTGRA